MIARDTGFVYVMRDPAMGRTTWLLEEWAACVLEVDGNNPWEVGEIHLIGGEDQVVLSLEADEVSVLLHQPSLFGGGRAPLDLWQAHADGDQLEIYAAGGPDEVAGFSDGDIGGDHDSVPFLDAAGKAANGVLIGRESLAPGDRLLWMRDGEQPGACRGVLFEAREYCQVACRTWNPQVSPEGIPLIFNYLEREPPPAMIAVPRLAVRLPGPRTWAPRPEAREEPALRLPGPERWLPQLRPKKDRLFAGAGARPEQQRLSVPPHSLLHRRGPNDTRGDR
ncbi:MAG: hypothetical protein HOZ81_43230 [Streptomyces sp.]|nr:hypothetical protein [Streptomyces sp.]